MANQHTKKSAPKVEAPPVPAPEPIKPRSCVLIATINRADGTKNETRFTLPALQAGEFFVLQIAPDVE